MTETGQGILIGTVFVFLACLVIPAFGILAALAASAVFGLALEWLVLRHLYNNRDGSPLTREAFELAVLQSTGIDCKVWLDENVYKKTTLPAAIRLI